MLAKDLFLRIGYTEEMVSAYHRYKVILGDRLEVLARETVTQSLPFLDSCHKVRTLIPEMDPNTIDLMFILECTGYLLEKYQAVGIPEELFYTAMQDIRCKTAECLCVRKIFGTFVAHWYHGFFAMTRFAFGRLQFDVIHHTGESLTICRHTVGEGDLVLNCHIPSLGPLHHDACLDSYRSAYAFFSQKLKARKLVVRCNSWMLMPDYMPIFQKNAPNIYRFAQDFVILQQKETATFTDGWRIFGVDVADRNPADLPADTRLRRGFLEHMSSGGKFGNGIGYLLFDGRQVLTENSYTA